MLLGAHRTARDGAARTRIERNRCAARADERIAPLIIADRGVFSGPGCMGSVGESRRDAVGFVIARADAMWRSDD